MAVRVVEKVTTLHSIRIHSVHFWSNSQCVLAQINSDRKLNQFVAPRIGEILDRSTRSQWRYVRSKENPADYATKWHEDTFNHDNLWFTGPRFLHDDATIWSQDPETTELEDVLCGVVEVNDLPEFPLLGQIRAAYFNDWRILRRIVARRIRFMRIKFLRKRPTEPFLTADDLSEAEEYIAAKIQTEAFPEEYLVLTRGEEVEPTSKLRQLSPFLSNRGALRARSRLQNSPLTYAAKNPLILPNRHPLVDALARHIHEINHHRNEETIIAAIRQRAWIMNIRSLVRRISHHCSTCKVLRAAPISPLMGDLPAYRTNPEAYVFEHTGTDCFGPLYASQGRARVKRYGMIFVCMMCRAIHIELLEDLSTDSCLRAVQNFANRRGPVRHLYSDNGTNFVGSANTLRRLRQELSPALADTMNLTWHFNPPNSPHFGGAWERMIQSVKRALEVIMDQRRLYSDHELLSILIEAEAIVNSHPLTHTPISTAESPPLKPNDFLLGRANQPILPATGDHSAQLSIKRVKAVANQIAKRWTREYLPVLMKRCKWLNDVKPLAQRDVVLIVDFSKPRPQWLRGRVERLFPGPDGRTRVADIKLTDGTIKNIGVAYLARLDIMSTPPSPLPNVGVDGPGDVADIDDVTSGHPADQPPDVENVSGIDDVTLN